MCEFKIDIIFGSVEPKTFHKFENGRMVVYGYSIHRDREGNVTHKTRPEPISSCGWDNNTPFTEKDYQKLVKL